MKTRRRNVSEDPLTITRRYTRSKKTSVNVTAENSVDTLPIDLIFEILARLSAKSKAKCRCVSKFWSSMLRRPDFTESFFNRSRTRPKLLFACRKRGGKFLLLSAPQPQNPDVNTSPVVCATRLMHFPFNDNSCDIIGPVHGLFCLIDKRLSKGLRKETVPVLCNPTTGQSLPLTKVKTRRVGVASYFGYDPIDKQFKVLCMTWTSSVGNRVFDEYQVLSIGTGKNMSWRMIKGFIPPHYSYDLGICINGVLYYQAGVNSFSEVSMLVCFDVKSEKFRFMELAGKGILVNYNGKLGLLNHGSLYVAGRKSIELWVLEDDEKKQEWLKHTFVFPTMWQEKLETLSLRIVGMTRANEVVLLPAECMPYSVFYFNIERNTIVNVGIRGMEEFEDTNVDLYLDHVEDVKLM